ncbi:MAG: hypothetical protein AAGJ18_14625, partial [Bacteroidota bacterium]
MEEPIPVISTEKPALPRYAQAFILVIKIIGYLFSTFLVGALIGEGFTKLTPQLKHEQMISGSLEGWESLSVFYSGLTIGAILCTWLFRKIVDQRA